MEARAEQCKAGIDARLESGFDELPMTLWRVARDAKMVVLGDNFYITRSCSPRRQDVPLVTADVGIEDLGFGLCSTEVVAIPVGLSSHGGVLSQ